MAIFEKLNVKIKSNFDVLIRAAHFSDATALFNLAKTGVNEDCFQLLTRDEFQLSVASEKAWIETYSGDPNKLIIVAEIDGTIVGQLDFTNGSPHRASHVGELEMLVKKEFRGQGVGQNLVMALISWASKNNDIEKIGLSVHSTNSRAIALYEKTGFKIEGIQKNELKYENGCYVDVLLMSRFV